MTKQEKQALDRQIGTRMRILREQNHMTQEQVAGRLGISTKHYSEVERGKSGLSLIHLIAVVPILETDLDFLLLGKTETMKIREPSMNYLSADSRSIEQTVQMNEIVFMIEEYARQYAEEHGRAKKPEEK